jgi:hypothetical protein
VAAVRRRIAFARGLLVVALVAGLAACDADRPTWAPSHGPGARIHRAVGDLLA